MNTEAVYFILFQSVKKRLKYGQADAKKLKKLGFIKKKSLETQKNLCI